MEKFTQKYNVNLTVEGKVKAAHYNPRDITADRLATLKDSLDKFGFIIPCYKNKNTDQLLSGHQRNKCFTGDKVPVISLTTTFEDEVFLNLYFNVMTSDLPLTFKATENINYGLSRIGNPKFPANYNNQFTDKLTNVNINELSNPLFTGERVQEMFAYLISTNMRLIKRFGYFMPLIVDRWGNIINGNARHLALKAAGYKVLPVIIVDWNIAKCIDFMKTANRKYGEFNFTKMFEQYRASQRFAQLGRGIGGTSGRALLNILYQATIGLDKAKMSKLNEKTILELLNNKIPKDSNVLDFGCGYFQQGTWLNSKGWNITPFEPFNKSLKIVGCDIGRTKKQLEKVYQFIKTGKRYDTIILDSVFNSVMLKSDRLYIQQLLAWLVSASGCVIISTRSDKDPHFKGQTQGLKLTDKSLGAEVLRAFDEENGSYVSITNGEVLGQKFYTPQELKDELSNYFSDLKLTRYTTNLVFECRGPKIDKAFLKKAIEFEFNINYNGVAKLGMHEQFIKLI